MLDLKDDKLWNSGETVDGHVFHSLEVTWKSVAF